VNPVVDVAGADILRRIRAEFIEMPGLRLTVTQAQRLWALDRSTCERVIDSLVASGFLTRMRDGAAIVRGEK
jgi:DNA-binding MarR family transcriptional regulator